MFSSTLQDHSVPLLHTKTLPFTENSTEKGRKGSSQWTPDRHSSAGKPGQLTINNVPVKPWPQVMSKALKSSPELISRAPEEKSYNTPNLSTPQNIKVMENKQNLRNGYNLKSQKD